MSQQRSDQDAKDLPPAKAAEEPKMNRNGNQGPKQKPSTNPAGSNINQDLDPEDPGSSAPAEPKKKSFMNSMKWSGKDSQQKEPEEPTDEDDQTQKTKGGRISLFKKKEKQPKQDDDDDDAEKQRRWAPGRPTKPTFRRFRKKHRHRKDGDPNNPEDGEEGDEEDDEESQGSQEESEIRIPDPILIGKDYWLCPLEPMQYYAPGLEPFSIMERVVVKDRFDVIPSAPMSAPNAKFDLYTDFGQRAFVAWERTQGNRSTRDFTMEVIGSNFTELIVFYKPTNTKCCGVGPQIMEIQSPPGVAVGKIIEKPGGKGQYEVQTPVGQRFGDIQCPHSPGMPVACVRGPTKLAMVHKNFMSPEYFKDQDNLTVDFDIESPVNVKVTMLGVLFFLKLVYYDGEPAKKKK